MKKITALMLVLLLICGCSSAPVATLNKNNNKKDPDNAEVNIKTTVAEFRGLKYEYPDALNKIDTYDDYDTKEIIEVYHHSSDDYFCSLLISLEEDNVELYDEACLWIAESTNYRVGKLYRHSSILYYNLQILKNGQPQAVYEIEISGYTEPEAEKLISLMEYNGEAIDITNRHAAKDLNNVKSGEELAEIFSDVRYLSLKGNTLKVKAPFAYNVLAPYLTDIESYMLDPGDKIKAGEYACIDARAEGNEFSLFYDNNSSSTVHFMKADELSNDQLIVTSMSIEYDGNYNAGLQIGEEVYLGNSIDNVIAELGNGYSIETYGGGFFYYEWDGYTDDVYSYIRVIVTDSIVYGFDWSFYAY